MFTFHDCTNTELCILAMHCAARLARRFCFFGIHWIGREAFCIVTIASFCLVFFLVLDVSFFFSLFFSAFFIFLHKTYWAASENRRPQHGVMVDGRTTTMAYGICRDEDPPSPSLYLSWIRRGRGGKDRGWDVIRCYCYWGGIQGACVSFLVGIALCILFLHGGWGFACLGRGGALELQESWLSSSYIAAWEGFPWGVFGGPRYPWLEDGCLGKEIGDGGLWEGVFLGGEGCGFGEM